MLNLFRKSEQLPITAVEQGALYDARRNLRLDEREVERVFTRLFLSEDGQKALSYLQLITFYRAQTPGVSEAELRHIEGQRAIVATIMRLINRGRGA